MTEPGTTAFMLAVLGALMALSVLVSRAAQRIGVPLALLFIVLGVLAGSEGLGRIAFEDYGFAFRLGTVALVLILFDGGLNTSTATMREGLRPALVLATLGVLLTALFVALAARLFGFGWGHALLLGAIVSSTDAAAVFSVLRGSGLSLKRRLGATLELESGLNDPMAVILTVGMTALLIDGGASPGGLVVDGLLQMAVGGGAGALLGWGGRQLLRRFRLPAGGLYPVLTLALAFLAFGLPTLFHGSGFLAVYLAGVLVGHGAIRYRSGVLRVHDALAWVSQVMMFLVLGLLVFPSQLVEVTGTGLLMGAVLTLARLVAVALCLLPFKFTWVERGYAGWVGLRGAVPIILATFPVLAGAEGARDIFNIVFFVVVGNALVPGSTVVWLTRRLGLSSTDPPPPPAALEITSTQLLRGEMLSFYVTRASAACGASLADLPFPPSATATMIVRGDELLAPRGDTVLQEGDHIYVLCKMADVPLIRLLFGWQESE
jgi:cell volume regulation protein A